jgi:hypothetical protein
MAAAVPAVLAAVGLAAVATAVAAVWLVVTNSWVGADVVAHTSTVRFDGDMAPPSTAVRQRDALTSRRRRTV